MLPTATQPCRRASRLLLRLLARSQPAPPPDARLRFSTLASNFDTLDSFEEIDEGLEDGSGDSLVPWVDEAAANEPSLQKCVRVAVIGAPNAGKSTLTNALVGSLVSAVSRKTNTTRSEVLGCATLGATQLLLHDTPGVVCPESWRGAQHASRVASAWRVAATADVLLFVVDAARQAETADPRVPLLFRRARAELAAASERRVRGDRGLSLIDVGREGEEGGGADENSAPLPPSLLVLNKVDRIPSLLRLGSLRGLLDTLGECHPFQSAFGTAALLRRGVGPLAQALLSYARPGPWPLPPTRLTDRGPTAQALAATTGALFDRLHEELPYEVRVKHTSWEDFRDGSVRIEQALLVPNENVRAMVIGKHGAAVGQIGIQARRVLERTFGRRVHLILKVKVSRGRDTVDVDEGYHAEVVQFSALARARAVQRLEQASLAKAAAEA